MNTSAPDREGAHTFRYCLRESLRAMVLFELSDNMTHTSVCSNTKGSGDIFTCPAVSQSCSRNGCPSTCTTAAVETERKGKKVRQICIPWPHTHTVRFACTDSPDPVKTSVLEHSATFCGGNIQPGEPPVHTKTFPTDTK